MRDVALFVHILGWAQWMGAHTALAGLLRKDALFHREVGPRLAKQLRALWITLFVGGVITVGGGIWLVVITPAYAHQGFVLTKMLLVLVGFFIAIIPMRTAQQNLAEGGAPLSGMWFGISLAVFIASIALGVFKPF